MGQNGGHTEETLRNNNKENSSGPKLGRQTLQKLETVPTIYCEERKTMFY